MLRRPQPKPSFATNQHPGWGGRSQRNQLRESNLLVKAWDTSCEPVDVVNIRISCSLLINSTGACPDWYFSRVWWVWRRKETVIQKFPLLLLHCDFFLMPLLVTCGFEQDLVLADGEGSFSYQKGGKIFHPKVWRNETWKKHEQFSKNLESPKIFWFSDDFPRH